MKNFKIIIFFLSILFFSCEKKTSENKIDIKKEISIPIFNKENSFNYLIAQTKFGPRVPNTQSHNLCLNFLHSELKKFADTVILQNFSQQIETQNLNLTNIFAQFEIQRQNRILLSAHWDTRPFADRDEILKKQNLPILGANDGASGVSVLLEIAKILKIQKPNCGVDILFVDGEDFGKEGTENYLLGSKYFAKNFLFKTKPQFGILLDMVGDKNLKILKEKNSIYFAPNIVDLIWNTANEIGIYEFEFNEGSALLDDHIPFNEIGIPTVDIIDFEYPDETNKFWHTTQDIPENCSGESLEKIGKVILKIIYTQ